MNARTRQIRELDQLVGTYIKHEASGICAKCGNPRMLQSAHVLSKGPQSRLRFEPDNLMPLCGGCHLYWHQRPKEALEWFDEKYPGRYERLQIAARCAPKLDLKLLLQIWRKEVAKL